MLMYYFVSFFLGAFSFGIKRKHLLLMLLSLEYMVLFLFVLVFLYLSMSFDYFFSMIFLTFSVCEGALGLSILVSLIRTHGNDYFKSFSILW
uniref:NADH-ubiquinone oxidoreductase chain 4L n=1 Tax=Mordella atrata TaxID=633874 RepID=C8YXF2_9CUCU|nr:NADH dehydrogenase subunit 4L [Mordella atrata]ACO92586.1 NADH dehydrogenase subunit 4L [Mordella atrata]